MERRLVSFEGWRVRTPRVLVAAVMVVFLAGCTAAQTTPGAGATASTGSSPSMSAAPSGSPAASPTPVVTNTPAPTYTPASSPTATPPLPTGPLPVVGAAPTGTWTGINWIALPAGHAPAAPLGAYNYVNLFGWSGGFVDLVWNDKNRTIGPWVSADGLTWRAGSNLPLGNLLAGVGQADAWAKAGGMGSHDACDFNADGFAAGASSLLVKGYIICDMGCGSWFSAEATWTSTDGSAWRSVDLKFAQHGAGEIAGGPNGFIATSPTTKTETIWTSADGITWHQAALPSGVVTGAAKIGQPAAISGGYVVAGVVSNLGPSGCMGQGSELQTAAVWWSATGSIWTRETLPGTTPGYLVDMQVDRIGDHALLARQGSYARADTNVAKTAAWTSTDGRNWKLLAGPSPAGFTVLSAGSHCVLVNPMTYGLAPGTHPAILGFDTNLNLTTLKQSGDIPWIDWGTAALGPTGLLKTADGIRFWLGVPTAA